MIKVKIQAGLGNQMFQYALARSIKEKTNKEVVLDLSFYTDSGVATGDTVRGFDLDKFNIDNTLKFDYSSTPKKISIFEKIKRRLLNESAFVFYKKYLNPKENSYLIGFWQSEKYFKSIEYIIRKEFTLKNKIEDREYDDESKNILEEIENSSISISINVRRGDYATNQKVRRHHGLISKEYYTDAINFILNKLNIDKNLINFFIFSDDIEWCKDNFKDLENSLKIFYVSKDISATDTLYLISKCSHNIIVNSSFSWWGAWLNENKDKIVITPKHWMRVKMDIRDVVPEEWIKLENGFY